MLQEDPRDILYDLTGEWFQWAPTLGGECYALPTAARHVVHFLFQWAPTLGGECYGIVYLITPPLCQGVDALLNNSTRF